MKNRVPGVPVPLIIDDYSFVGGGHGHCNDVIVKYTGLQKKKPGLSHHLA